MLGFLNIPLAYQTGVWKIFTDYIEVRFKKTNKFKLNGNFANAYWTE
jgi:hypothetical protein